MKGKGTTYFVTGGTGLIGKHLVERLIKRGGRITLLVRASSLEANAKRFEAWVKAAGEAGGSFEVISGDLKTPNLGLQDLSVLAVDHVFHLAALYDVAADSGTLERINVLGTEHLIEALKTAEFSGLLHHVSSIAVAGNFEGVFKEDMLDEGQTMPHPYHRTKRDSEKLVRKLKGTRYRIYRPGAVVGHSETGEMDRIDGPYYMFKPIQRLSRIIPPWIPLPGPSGAGMNIVPVDFVAGAIDHLAHAPDLDGETFHVVDPKPPSLARTIDTLLKAAKGPRLRFKLPKRRSKGLSTGLQVLRNLPAAKAYMRRIASDLGAPEEVVGVFNPKVTFDTAKLEAGLEGSGIGCPRFNDYALKLWRYYEEHLDPNIDREGKWRKALEGRRVLITGSSMGVGESLAVRCGQLGAEVVLVARSEDKLAAVKKKIEDEGGTAYVVAADLSVMEECDRVAEETLRDIGPVDVIVNNAARSIRRRIIDTVDRFHDYERTMQLNYFAPVRLVLAFLPSMVERKTGHILSILTSGVFVGTPLFGAYLATKRALDAFTDTFASEFMHEGLEASSVYLPLVRTPMIAPTREYDDTPAITPEKAAEQILDAIADKTRRAAPGWAKAIAMSWVYNARGQTRFLNMAMQLASGSPELYPGLDLERMLLRKAGFKGILF